MIYNSKLSVEEQNQAKIDLEKVHFIRGRILHFSSLLEYVILMTINEKLWNKYNQQKKKPFVKATLKDKIKIFIKKCEAQNMPEIKEFEKSIKKCVKYRDVWAHGFVYYHEFKIDPLDKIKKPINFIGYPHFGELILKPISFESDYFKVANKEFPFIMGWLEKNKVFEGLEKRKFYGLDQEKQDY